MQDCITPSPGEANQGTVRCGAASAVTVIAFVVKEEFGGLVQPRDRDLRLVVVPKIISLMAELGFRKSYVLSSIEYLHTKVTAATGCLRAPNGQPGGRTNLRAGVIDGSAGVDQSVVFAGALAAAGSSPRQPASVLHYQRRLMIFLPVQRKANQPVALLIRTAEQLLSVPHGQSF